MKSTIIAFLLMLTGSLAWAGAKEDLYNAIIKGDIDGVKKAIAAGADVNEPDKNGNTPLTTAVFDANILKELIAAKADVNKFSTNNMMNPLLSAANWGLVDVMKTLVENGANVNAKDANGNNAMFYAAAMGTSAPAMQFLIDKGIDAKAVNAINQNALMFMANTGRGAEGRVAQLQGIVPYLDKAGIKLPEKIKNPKASDWSSVEERIDILLKAGIGIDDETSLLSPPTSKNAGEVNKAAKVLGLKQWPLYLAMNNLFGGADVTKALIVKGADAKKENGRGMLSNNMLHALATNKLSKQNAEVVDALAKGGIDLNAKDIQGITPLMKAAKAGNKDEVAGLIRNGADLNITQKSSSMSHEYDIIEGTTNTFTSTWRTALDWAAETDHDEIAQMIEKAGGLGAKKAMKGRR